MTPSKQASLLKEAAPERPKRRKQQAEVHAYDEVQVGTEESLRKINDKDKAKKISERKIEIKESKLKKIENKKMESEKQLTEKKESSEGNQTGEKPTGMMLELENIFKKLSKKKKENVPESESEINVEQKLIKEKKPEKAIEKKSSERSGSIESSKQSSLMKEPRSTLEVRNLFDEIKKTAKERKQK